MAINSDNKAKNSFPEVLEFEGKISKDKVIKSKSNSYYPIKSIIAIRQIENLMNKMKLHPHLKDHCLNDIKKIIWLEKGGRLNE